MIVFIILHYKNFQDTLECIDSIKLLQLINYKIVVVENGSLDSSTEDLKSIQGEVEVVFNNINYGFAKGNNSGIKYAREKYDPKFYIVINNDIIIKDETMFEEIHKMEELYQFDVLGPKIIARNNINQNPNYLVLYKNIDIIKHLIRISMIDLLINTGLYNKVKNYKQKNSGYVKEVEKNMTLEGVPLHGAAIIFSSRYINKYDEPFDESTFLYGEEEFLYYRKIRDGLKFIYTPDISVYHKEDASLNELFKNSNTKKTKFVIKNSKQSLIKLLNKKLSDKLGGHKYEWYC